MKGLSPTVMPRVSVVLPVYNGADFLPAALGSVLTQSIEDLELVAVDDGSTDATPAILLDWAGRDARIRIHRKTNAGISQALNAGLKLARAPWVARLDADDIMMPDRLERQLAFLADNPDLVAAGSDYELINSDGARRGRLCPLPRTREQLSQRLAARDVLTFTHPTMIYRRDTALGLGGYRGDMEPCEDADLFARMLETGGTILIQPEVLTLYRVHGGSISGRRTAEQFHKLHYIFENFYARRDGLPTVSYDAFRACQSRLPILRRVRLTCDLTSERLYRAYTSARVEGRTAQAACCLAVAASLRPFKALKRGLRGIGASRFKTVQA